MLSYRYRTSVKYRCNIGCSFTGIGTPIKQHGCNRQSDGFFLRSYCVRGSRGFRLNSKFVKNKFTKHHILINQLKNIFNITLVFYQCLIGYSGSILFCFLAATKTLS
jgi:hypothetical protein